jgi:hypothetical protein
MVVNAPTTPPARIRIVGTSGSGKSRLAEDVAARMHIARLELDAVFWDAGWTYRDLEEAQGRVRAFLAAHPEGGSRTATGTRGWAVSWSPAPPAGPTSWCGSTTRVAS